MRLYCNKVTEKYLDKNLELSGWVSKRRDHGGIIFIDLRDYTGIVQLVFNPDNKELFSLAESLRSEDVVTINGLVNMRLEGTINKELATGAIEVIVSDLFILNKS